MKSRLKFETWMSNSDVEFWQRYYNSISADLSLANNGRNGQEMNTIPTGDDILQQNGYEFTIC